MVATLECRQIKEAVVEDELSLGSRERDVDEVEVLAESICHEHGPQIEKIGEVVGQGDLAKLTGQSALNDAGMRDCLLDGIRTLENSSPLSCANSPERIIRASRG